MPVGTSRCTYWFAFWGGNSPLVYTVGWLFFLGGGCNLWRRVKCLSHCSRSPSASCSQVQPTAPAKIRSHERPRPPTGCWRDGQDMCRNGRGTTSPPQCCTPVGQRRNQTSADISHRAHDSRSGSSVHSPSARVHVRRRYGLWPSAKGDRSTSNTVGKMPANVVQPRCALLCDPDPPPPGPVLHSAMESILLLSAGGTCRGINAPGAECCILSNGIGIPPSLATLPPSLPPVPPPPPRPRANPPPPPTNNTSPAQPGPHTQQLPCSPKHTCMHPRVLLVPCPSRPPSSHF